MITMFKMEKFTDRKDVREKIQNFALICKKFYDGELSISEYKSISGGFGTYSQRNHKTGMLRLRIPAGILEMKHLKFVVDCIEKYNISKYISQQINQYSYMI